MKFGKILEFKEEDLYPINSFYLKDTLNKQIWDNYEIDQDIRRKLLKIAADFYEMTELKAEVKDIVLTGSLCNFNYSTKYSDFDLHILINFKEVNDDVELVKKYTDAIKTVWNRDHDIKIKGYDVELYIQDVSELHRSTGIYSLLKDKWKIKPVKINFKIDRELIKEKAKFIMRTIDNIEEEKQDLTYDELKEKISMIWSKIKKMRKEGLEKGGEFSTGNLVFKLLRRNKYIEKVIHLKKISYDKQFESKNN